MTANQLRPKTTRAIITDIDILVNFIYYFKPGFKVPNLRSELKVKVKENEAISGHNSRHCFNGSSFSFDVKFGVGRQ